MFDFTVGKPLPDACLFGVSRKFRQIKLQLTAFCHNRCKFCPLPSDHSFPKGIMDVESLKIVLRAVPDYDGHVEIATDGESLLLDDLPERCALIKKHWPRCTLGLITTFNIDRGPEFIKSLFASGLHILHVSCYGHTPEDYKRIHGTDGFTDLRRNISYLSEVSDLKEKQLLLINVHNAEKELNIVDADKKLITFQRFAEKYGFRSTTTRLHSWQGRVPFGLHEERRAPYPCSVTWGGWADILHVRWNLEIVPCCAFNGSEYSFGNLHNMSLHEIFSSHKFEEFYLKHWEGREKEIPVCKTCTNYKSFASPEELARFAAWQDFLLKGKEVWFWGAGEAWRRYSPYFNSVRPRAILLDTQDAPRYAAGLPVLHPDKVLKHSDNLPMIIFAYPKHTVRILNSIAERYPEYKLDNITLCPADFLLGNTQE